MYTQEKEFNAHRCFRLKYNLNFELVWDSRYFFKFGRLIRAKLRLTSLGYLKLSVKRWYNLDSQIWIYKFSIPNSFSSQYLGRYSFIRFTQV